MRQALSFFLVCVLAGCQTGPAEPDLTGLRATPTSAIVAGQPFELDVDLWRDFMPVVPGSADGRPLAVVVRLPDRLTTVRVERIWVIFGDDVWSAEAERAQGTQDWVARNGPKWGPGVRVDVVARLREATGNEVLVRAPDRMIQRTD